MRNSQAASHISIGQTRTSPIHPLYISPLFNSLYNISSESLFRPALERASSSISTASTSTTVPQVDVFSWSATRQETNHSYSSENSPGAEITEYSEIYRYRLSHNQSQSEIEVETRSTTPVSDETIMPVPTLEHQEIGVDNNSQKKNLVSSILTKEIQETTRQIPAITSPPLPLPLESYQDTIHTERELATSCSSYLRSGSKFEGTQQSGSSTYKVHVELKHVNMSDSFICGYLHIQGLTEDHPTLTTYFEGEIIGPKHSFLTKRWDASKSTDIAHWARFPSWRPFAQLAKRPEYRHMDFESRDHIFMRWKECFLVPDHRVRDINGASFAGFYYICFNQIEGSISGLYFHLSSEKYQQLDLSHVPDHGRQYAYEFR
ncbi:vacuolar import and degradation protein-domain-containing protein [Lipomyces oligophaga]|uniref:vacuolar import and degradation protein-domain-containing protein n=1 Tax=Lipomyces oligophaga TaxID=45792 RepID=UPI0034CE6F1C